MATPTGGPEQTSALPPPGLELPSGLIVCATDTGPCVGIYQEFEAAGATVCRALLVSGWHRGGLVAENHVSLNGMTACHHYAFDAKTARWNDGGGNEKYVSGPASVKGTRQIRLNHQNTLGQWWHLLRTAGAEDSEQDVFLPGNLAGQRLPEMALTHRFYTDTAWLAVQGLAVSRGIHPDSSGSCWPQVPREVI